MFDHVHKFEIELAIGTVEVSTFSGEALLEHDTGYEFVVTGIELEGNQRGDYRNKRTVNINAKSDDPFMVALFNKLGAAIRQDADAQEAFVSAMEEHTREAA